MDLDFNAIIFICTLLIGYFAFRKSRGDAYTFDALNVKHNKPWPLIGNFLPLLTGAEGGISFFEKLYKQFRDEK